MDSGETWQPLWANLDISGTVLTAKSSSGIYYKLQSHADGEIGLPTSVQESTDNGKTWHDIFPYKNMIYSIYIDNTDRVYLGMNDWKWNGQTGSFDASMQPGNSILYYLKK